MNGKPIVHVQNYHVKLEMGRLRTNYFLERIDSDSEKGNDSFVTLFTKIDRL